MRLVTPELSIPCPVGFEERSDDFSWEFRCGGSYGERSLEAKTTGSLTILESIDGMRQPRTKIRNSFAVNALPIAYKTPISRLFWAYQSGQMLFVQSSQRGLQYVRRNEQFWSVRSWRLKGAPEGVRRASRLGRVGRHAMAKRRRAQGCVCRLGP